jgi:hypothetical protein
MQHQERSTSHAQAFPDFVLKLPRITSQRNLGSFSDEESSPQLHHLLVAWHMPLEALRDGHIMRWDAIGLASKLHQVLT